MSDKHSENKPEKTIDALLHEERQFPPPESYRARANVSSDNVYQKASEDLEGFWEEQAEGFTFVDFYNPDWSHKCPVAIRRCACWPR